MNDDSFPKVIAIVVTPETGGLFGMEKLQRKIVDRLWYRLELAIDASIGKKIYCLLKNKEMVWQAQDRSHNGCYCQLKLFRIKVTMRWQVTLSNIIWTLDLRLLIRVFDIREDRFSKIKL